MIVTSLRAVLFIPLAIIIWPLLVCAEEIDIPGGPFSYPRYPTDVLGWPGYPEGTLVTPEGYLYTGDTEILFYVGDPPQPVAQRIRTLERGWLPIIHYSVAHDSVVYRFTMLAAPFPCGDREELINFVRVRMTNTGQTPTRGMLSCAYRYGPEKESEQWVHRFRRPAKPDTLGGYLQAGTPYDPHWGYRFEEDLFAREHQLVYLWRDRLKRFDVCRYKTLVDFSEGKTAGQGDFRILDQTASTIVGITSLATDLSPGEREEIVIVVPYGSVPLSFGEMLQALRRVRFGSVTNRVRHEWQEIASRGMSISLPEEKVVDTWNASLVYDLIALDRLGDEYVQKVNEFQYDAFWLRDASFFVRAYDLTGYHDLAERCVDHFLDYQQEDGNFVSQPGQLDGWGQALWAFGQHVEMTRDERFAKKVFPAVQAAVAWLKKAREEDPLRLVPSTTPGDAELISGHVTGHNFWALLGLRSAIHVAEWAGEKQAAREYQTEYEDFQSTLYTRLEEVTADTGGVIPPGLDGDSKGEDWGNLIGVFPTGVLDPFDPMVAATQRHAKSRFKEGLMTYATDYLHHYLTTYITETDLVRGDQEEVLRQLYAILAHTSATHAGWEWSVRAWGDRDFGGNLSPHGWFAARYRILLRNMLVREQGDSLHLFSTVSPEWIERRGARIVVSRAPTRFGSLDFRLKCLRSGRVHVAILPDWTAPPEEVVIHVPWYREVVWHSAGRLRGGEPGQTVVLAPNEGSLIIQWRKIHEPLPYSYQEAVDDLLAGYASRAASKRK